MTLSPAFLDELRALPDAAALCAAAGFDLAAASSFLIDVIARVNQLKADHNPEDGGQRTEDRTPISDLPSSISER